MSLPLHGKINPISFFVAASSVFVAGFSSQAPLGSTPFKHVVANLMHVYLLFLSFIACFAVMLQPGQRSRCVWCLLAVKESFCFRWLIIEINYNTRKCGVYPQFRGGDLMCGLYKGQNLLNTVMFPLTSNQQSNSFPVVTEGACSIIKNCISLLIVMTISFLSSKPLHILDQSR